MKIAKIGVSNGQSHLVSCLSCGVVPTNSYVVNQKSILLKNTIVSVFVNYYHKHRFLNLSRNWDVMLSLVSIITTFKESYKVKSFSKYEYIIGTKKNKTAL